MLDRKASTCSTKNYFTESQSVSSIKVESGEGGKAKKKHLCSVK